MLADRLGQRAIQAAGIDDREVRGPVPGQLGGRLGMTRDVLRPRAMATLATDRQLVVRKREASRFNRFDQSGMAQQAAVGGSTTERAVDRVVITG